MRCLLFIPFAVVALEPDAGGAVGGNLSGAGLANGVRRGARFRGEGFTPSKPDVDTSARELKAWWAANRAEKIDR